MTIAPTLPLAQVTETDSLRSMRPLVLGRMPGRYVTGVNAILRRVLYAWAIPRGLLPYDPTFGCGLLWIEGATLADRALLSLRRRLEVAAIDEDYVQSATVPLTFANGVLTIPGSILLVDGRTYPLEVSLSNVGAAIDAIGAT